MDLEVQQHLKDHLFHGVCKHICDSIEYLYSTPGVSFSQLMVATQKAQSENEVTQERVRARAKATNKPREGMSELGQQIAKLMATLAHTRQGSNPFNMPGSPQEHGCGHGHGRRSTSSCPNSCNGRGSPGLMTLACSLSTEHGAEGNGSQGGGNTLQGIALPQHWF